MRAVRYHEYGSADVLEVEDVDVPITGPGQVVSKVAGAAFNAVDQLLRSGAAAQLFSLALPHTPNYDVSVTITDIGTGVTGWVLGDPVIAFLPVDAPGGAAQYTLVPAEELVAAPAAVGLIDAAAPPSVGLTAWQALFEHAHLQPWYRVFINRAGGAVGGLAVQLAAHIGAHVAATSSVRSAHRLRGSGAEHLIDHTTTPLPQSLRLQTFDAVINLAATDTPTATALQTAVVDGGGLVSTTTPSAITQGGYKRCGWLPTTTPHNSATSPH